MEECTICLENTTLERTKITDCKHTFHTECLEKWLTTNNSCPLCRTNINPSFITNISDTYITGNTLQNQDELRYQPSGRTNTSRTPTIINYEIDYDSLYPSAILHSDLYSESVILNSDAEHLSESSYQPSGRIDGRYNTRIGAVNTRIGAVNTYSFAVEPEVHQPSGRLNMHYHTYSLRPEIYHHS